MSSFNHSFDIASPMLGGIAAGQQQQSLQQQQVYRQQILQQQQQYQQQQQDQLNQKLFQERSARTYNMGRLRMLMGSDPSLAGAESQTMDAFANMPASMQGSEIDRMQKEMDQRRRKAKIDALAYPFFDSLRQEGYHKEAALREARYRAGDPESLNNTSLQHLFSPYVAKEEPAQFDPNAWGRSLMGQEQPEGWHAPMQAVQGGGMGTGGGEINPVAAQRLATIARLSGKQPGAVQVERMLYGASQQPSPNVEAMTDALILLYPDQPRDKVRAWVEARFSKLPVPPAKLGTERNTPDKGAIADAEKAVIDAESEVKALQEELKELRSDEAPKPPADADGRPGFFGRLAPGNDAKKFEDKWLSEQVEERRTKLSTAHTRLTEARKRREDAKVGRASSTSGGRFTPEGQGNQQDEGGDESSTRERIRQMKASGMTAEQIKAALRESK